MYKYFPWYDSAWLADFENARSIIRRVAPERLAEFEAAFEPLRTRRKFDVVELPGVFSEEMLSECREFIRNLSLTQQEKHELFTFGRLVVHNDDFFNRIQRGLVETVSDRVNEELEISYNFLSLYRRLGICNVHMDSPEAKYTLDVCIEQSEDWPIWISKTTDWANSIAIMEENWEQQIRNDARFEFRPYTLRPGNGIIFSGSSQWHYRDPIPVSTDGPFCHLVFFHFIPKGTRHLVDVRKWAYHFGISEISNLPRRGQIAESVNLHA